MSYRIISYEIAHNVTCFHTLFSMMQFWIFISSPLSTYIIILKHITICHVIMPCFALIYKSLIHARLVKRCKS